MSEQNEGAGTAGTTEETNSQQQEQPREFEAITSQADLDKVIQARIARERAKFQDYDELKAAKAELDKIRESQKTEAEKVQERLDAAEKRAQELELKATRAEVAAAKGIPAELLTGSTQEELEASADALIQFRGEQPKGLHIPSEGKTPPAAGGSTAEQFAAAMEGQL